MTSRFTHFIGSMLVLASAASSSGQGVYTNFVRQVQLPTGTQYDVSVDSKGSQLSALAINPGGARFELWTILSDPLTSYLLDNQYVSSYTPNASVYITTEDPYTTIPRTRCDRPFKVTYTVSGLLSGANDPAASKSVTFMRYIQSYGSNGTGIDIDRTQASLKTKTTITGNGTSTLNYAVTAVPGGPLTKIWGEENFKIYTIADTNAPASQLCSAMVQMWPVADGSIAGITSGQLIRVAMPTLTLTYNDLYPASTTYVQVYQGNPVLGTTGTVVPGSALVLNETLPVDRVLTVSGYDSVINADGTWTMELITITPFGVDRLAYVTFSVNRMISMNGTFTTNNN